MHHNAGSIVLEGVDVTGYPIFSDAKVYHLYLHCLIACDLLLKCHKIPIFWRQVQKAIAFARKAHHGQLRKTGDPYLTHCIHTGRIIAVLVPSTGKRVGVIFCYCGAVSSMSLTVHYLNSYWLFAMCTGCRYSSVRDSPWRGWWYLWKFGQHKKRVWWWRSKVGSWSFQVKLCQSGRVLLQHYANRVAVKW